MAKPKKAAHKAVQSKEQDTPSVPKGTYEVTQDFTDWAGERTDYKKGQDASTIHPSKIQKYLDGGFIKKSAPKEEK